MKTAELALRVQPLMIPVEASLRLPGSKSHANRAIVAACLCEGQATMIENATPCDDVVLMVENLRRMGFEIEWIEKDAGKLRIEGGVEKTQDARRKTEDPIVLHCENAGTTVRFLTSLCSIVPGDWVIDGNEHMRKRPIGDLARTLRALGADIEATNDCPPIRIRGKKLKGGAVTLDASRSSQFLTSLLLIAPMLTEGLAINIATTLTSSGYVDLTKKVMSDFGVQVREEKNTFIVQNQNYSRKRGEQALALSGAEGFLPAVTIEGDWSAAGPWVVLRTLTKSAIDFQGMNPHSSQSDRKIIEVIQSLKKPGDVTLDCEQIPDQVMNIAVYAAFRKGSTTITGAANLRLKECDRLAVITSELEKAGIDITQHEDGIIIRGLTSKNQQPSAINQKIIVLDPHEDHRMAMAFAILGCVRPDITIKNPSCVSKSYPHFFQDLQSVRSQAKPIAIIGMRAIGKSSLGRRLAARSRLMHVDTDKEFERLHGPIPQYVQAKGWAAFRGEEEKVVAACIRPGCVVSLGGGAVESAATRALLKQRSIVVWMHATDAMIVKRLQVTKRPKLTDLPVGQEVRAMLHKRDPQYRSIAAIILPHVIPFGGQVPYVQRKLKSLLFSSAA